MDQCKIKCSTLQWFNANFLYISTVTDRKYTPTVRWMHFHCIDVLDFRTQNLYKCFIFDSSNSEKLAKKQFPEYFEGFESITVLNSATKVFVIQILCWIILNIEVDSRMLLQKYSYQVIFSIEGFSTVTYKGFSL